jgi:hypothetical protein
MKKIILILLFFCSILFGQEKYSRDKFGEGWNTYRGCITVREHVLISQSQDMVVMDSKNCNIERGKWYSIWENKYYDDPEKIDIDHTVPLKWAYIHGAYKWDDQQRNEFANNYTDEYHLVPLSKYSNRSKGSKGPDRWLPPHNRCLYIKIFIEIVDKHKLEFNLDEKNKIEELQKKECK